MGNVVIKPGMNEPGVRSFLEELNWSVEEKDKVTMWLIAATVHAGGELVVSEKTLAMLRSSKFRLSFERDVENRCFRITTVEQ